MQIVDAHHHLWDLDEVHYPWLMARGVKRFFGDPTPIRKNYLAADLRRDAGPLDLLGTVHVQVGTSPGQETAETRWLEATANREGLPSAIVAFCELQRDDLDAQLDAHARASRLRGVRQIVGRSADEDAKTGSGTLLDDPASVAGLGKLAARGLSFDLQLIPAQMLRCADILSRIPDLKVALCHCGSPWDQSVEGLSKWRRRLEVLAENPNVSCKISGLGMFDHDWSVNSIRPIVETCLDVFGVDRCMFGSNFPVDKLHASYTEVWSAYEQLTSSLGADERAGLFIENARAFYRF